MTLSDTEWNLSSPTVPYHPSTLMSFRFSEMKNEPNFSYLAAEYAEKMPDYLRQSP